MKLPTRKYTRRTDPIYKIWLSMMHRCYKKHRLDFQYYGKRGISVCKRWHDFEVFKADMGGEYAKGLTIDRIDNNGNYEISNCRWTTHKQQCRNRRTTHWITDVTDGKRYTVTELSAKYMLPRTTVSSRIHILGLTKFEEIVAPVTHKGGRPRKYDYAQEEITQVQD